MLKKESPFDANNQLDKDPICEDSLIKEKIYLYESVSPVNLLFLLQKGKKVSASVVRKGLNNAQDTINYLKRNGKTFRY